MWADQTVYVIGGGPSLQGMDLSIIHGKPVIGVNNAFELGPWVDVTFFGDKTWWLNNYKSLLRHPSLIVTCNAWGYYSQLLRVKRMKKNNRTGLWTRNRGGLCWNKNSGAAAVNLALHFGAAKIVLVAFDMKVDAENGSHNWHDSHEKWKGKTPSVDIYAKRFIPAFTRVKADLDKLNNSGNGHRRVEILNATPGSELKDFPMMELETTL